MQFIQGQKSRRKLVRRNVCFFKCAAIARSAHRICFTQRALRDFFYLFECLFRLQRTQSLFHAGCVTYFHVFIGVSFSFEAHTECAPYSERHVLALIPLLRPLLFTSLVAHMLKLVFAGNAALVLPRNQCVPC